MSKASSGLFNQIVENIDDLKVALGDESPWSFQKKAYECTKILAFSAMLVPSIVTFNVAAIAATSFEVINDISNMEHVGEEVKAHLVQQHTVPTVGETVTLSLYHNKFV